MQKTCTMHLGMINVSYLAKFMHIHIINVDAISCDKYIIFRMHSYIIVCIQKTFKIHSQYAIFMWWMCVHEKYVTFYIRIWSNMYMINVCTRKICKIQYMCVDEKYVIFNKICKIQWNM